MEETLVSCFVSDVGGVDLAFGLLFFVLEAEVENISSA